jgi:hypothetical protein
MMISSPGSSFMRRTTLKSGCTQSVLLFPPGPVGGHPRAGTRIFMRMAQKFHILFEGHKDSKVFIKKREVLGGDFIADHGA